MGIGMKNFRIFLLPIATILELLLLLICWLLAPVFHNRVLRMQRWVLNTLPGIEWYLADGKLIQKPACKCCDCKRPIIGSDDDARLCIGCGGRNRLY